MSDIKEGLSTNVVALAPQTRRRGRPPKSVVESKKNRGKVGRPAGDAARIQEFKARLLSSSGTKIIDTVLRKAMDDNDKDQVACLKMCLDRMLPTSLFEKDAKGQRNAIQINITGIGEAKIESTADVVDMEVDEDDES